MEFEDVVEGGLKMEDLRCFIDCNGDVHFVKDLEPGSYEVEDQDDYIQINLLGGDLVEPFIVGEYVLHDTINDLLDLIANGDKACLFDALIDACHGIPKEDREGRSAATHATYLVSIHTKN